MTEQVDKTESTEEKKPAAATAAATAEMDVTLEEKKPGFFSKINILKLFRKESPEMYIKEGHNLVENHNLALATMAFQKAIQLAPDNAEGHKGLGNVYLRKGGRSGFSAALESFKNATAAAPFEDFSYAMTARIYEKLGMMKEATLERKKMMIVKTLKTDAKNHIANNNMGILLLGQKQVTEAIEYFQKSIASNPAYDVAYRNLAATYFRQAVEAGDDAKKAQNLNQSRAFIGKALAINHTCSSLLVSGKIMVEEGRLEDALGIAEEAENLENTNKDVFAFKRTVLEKMKRTKDAQEAYESYQNIVDQTPD